MAGLVGAQLLALLAPDVHGSFGELVKLLTMACLSFIMVHVGYEFDIDKSALRTYGWDYVVAATAAALPWIFSAAYFVFALLPAESWSSWPAWKGALLIGRFASPTSAGVLFAMLAAAGLAGTWVFRKARILAIFDDIDTILFMVPLKTPGQDPHGHDTVEGHEIGLESSQEQQVATLVSGTFMVLVGLSMPPIATLMASTTGGGA